MNDEDRSLNLIQVLVILSLLMIGIYAGIAWLIFG